MAHSPQSAAPAAARPTEAAASTDLARIGGLEALGPLMRAFVARLVQDIMVGFFFARVDARRLWALETQFAAAHLGGRPYRGRSIGEAHAALPIAGGHFARRRRILQETLVAYGVPEDIQQRWLAHQEALRPQVVRGAACPADG